MDEAIQNILNNLGIIGLLAVTFGETFGPRQTQISEAVIRAGKVKSAYKPAVNIVTSIIIAVMLGGVLAIYAGWQSIPIMALAGLLSGTKAADVHDARKGVDPKPEKPPEDIRFRPDRPREF